MKAQTHKQPQNIAMNEFDTNTHVVMLIVYGALFGAWLIAKLAQ